MWWNKKINDISTCTEGSKSNIPRCAQRLQRIRGRDARQMCGSHANVSQMCSHANVSQMFCKYFANVLQMFCKCNADMFNSSTRGIMEINKPTWWLILLKLYIIDVHHHSITPLCQWMHDVTTALACSALARQSRRSTPTGKFDGKTNSNRSHCWQKPAKLYTQF
jgi:hypothetical protein